MKELKPLKQIKLTDSEKHDMKVRLLERINSESVKSPYVFLSFFSSSHFKFVYAAIAVFILSGSTALASLNTLPGDMLYPIKTEFLEKIPDILAWSDEAKARRNSKKLAERVKEFEVLAEQGRLDKKNATHIEVQVGRELDAFDKHVEKIKSENPIKEKLHVDLDATLQNHEEKIERIKKDNKSDNAVLNDFIDKNKERIQKRSNRKVEDESNKEVNTNEKKEEMKDRIQAAKKDEVQIKKGGEEKNNKPFRF